MKKIVILVVAILSAGCLPKNAFGPSPFTYEAWEKPGVDRVTIWKDMLDCNYPEPFNSGQGYEGGERTMDQWAASMVCMERLGYGYREERKITRVCQTSGWKSQPSCRPGADIPVPDTQRRLSSGYCKKLPNAAACTP